MKTNFKLFIRALVVVILLSLLLTVFAQAQSNSKINRLAKESSLYIKIAMADTLTGVYAEQPIFCGEDLVTHFINNRHFIAHSSKFTLDLDVKKRKVGKYNSWLARDSGSGSYYFITPFRVDGGPTGKGYGVFLQPVDKQLNRLYDLPIITISNFDVCQ